MAVFYKRDSGRLWPTVPIPIQQCDDSRLRLLFAAAVRELNQLVGWDVVAETEKSEGIHIVRATGSGSSVSTTNGYSTDPAKNKVSVNLNNKDASEKPEGENKFVIFHELLHALGFEHEQFHSQYPWQDSELPAQSAMDDAKVVRGKINIQSNQEIFDRLKQVYKNDFAPVQYLASRRKNLANNQLNTAWNDCDVNSILMYPEHRKILAEVFPAMEGRATAKVGSSGLLSAGDVGALRVMYPRPS